MLDLHDILVHQGSFHWRINPRKGDDAYNCISIWQSERQWHIWVPKWEVEAEFKTLEEALPYFLALVTQGKSHPDVGCIKSKKQLKLADGIYEGQYHQDLVECEAYSAHHFEVSSWNKKGASAVTIDVHQGWAYIKLKTT